MKSITLIFVLALSGCATQQLTHSIEPMVGDGKTWQIKIVGMRCEGDVKSCKAQLTKEATVRGVQACASPTFRFVDCFANPKMDGLVDARCIIRCGEAPYIAAKAKPEGAGPARETQSVTPAAAEVGPFDTP